MCCISFRQVYECVCFTQFCCKMKVQMWEDMHTWHTHTYTHYTLIYLGTVPWSSTVEHHLASCSLPLRFLLSPASIMSALGAACGRQLALCWPFLRREAQPVWVRPLSLPWTTWGSSAQSCPQSQTLHPEKLQFYMAPKGYFVCGLPLELKFQSTTDFKMPIRSGLSKSK